MSLALFSLLIVGVIATRSRAGLILLGPALAACLVMGWRGHRFGIGGRTFGVMVTVVLVALGAAGAA